jgi:hypothetical protein
MLRHPRLRPVGWLAGIGTLAAMVATMVLASPGGAASPEREYKGKFSTACVIGPGSLNQKNTLEVETSATGPETVTEGQTFEFHNATSTITSPAELGNTLFSLGARKVRGKVMAFNVVGTSLEPAEKNIANPPEFPEGLPYEVPVEQNKATSFRVPASGSYSFGPFKVIGHGGESAALSVSPTPGFKEIGAGEYEATGSGIVSTLEGVNAEGGHVVGPLTVACTAPSGVVLGTTPIIGTSTTSTSTSTSPTTTTTTSSTTTNSGEVSFSNWKLTGSLTDKKASNQVINLPSGCTFNGNATVPGPLEASTNCPAFKATLQITGSQPTTLGLELVQSEPVKGTITKAGGENVTFKATAKDNLLIKSVTQRGLIFPESCKTKEPVVFPLETTAPSSSLSTGTTFTGQTTIPSIKCTGGFLGSSFHEVLTKDLSGPNNPFTLTIGP